MKNKLDEKDICLIIATYNRAEDIEKTLLTLIRENNIPGKIVIVDQSKNDRTFKIIMKYKKRLPIEYIFCDIPSADISMNMGIKKYKDKFKLLLTAGDDVDFLKDYLKEMLKEFNIHPKVMAIGGVDNPIAYDFKKIKNKISNLIFKIFFLPFKEDHKFRITGPYGYTSSPFINKEIRDAQWIPGFNTCWRSEVYNAYLWPEIKGYNIIDDIDSSYYVYKKWGKGSLIMAPKCRVYHRHSDVERYVEKKRIFVNHEDHFSYLFMHFNNFTGILKLFLSILGIIFGNFIRSAAKPNKNNFNALIFNLEAIIYCFKHLKDIKNKKFRNFLNKDLSMI